MRVRRGRYQTFYAKTVADLFGMDFDRDRFSPNREDCGCHLCQNCEPSAHSQMVRLQPQPQSSETLSPKRYSLRIF